MIKRTLTGAVIVSLVYTWLFFSHIPAVLQIGTIVLGFLATFEILKICKTDQARNRYFSMIIAVLLLILPIPQYEYVILIILPLALILFGVMMARMEKITTFSYPIATVVSIAVVFLFKTIPCLRNLENGLYYLIFAVTACFVLDIAALFVGKAFGKRKLCPKISPKKTLAGAIGGAVCTMMIAMIAALLLQKFTDLRFNGILLAIWIVLLSVIAQFGDLCMSVVKRIAGVKDFGKLFPGHGGVLDRFDSQMMAIAFTLAFCAFTGGFLY